MQVTIEVDDEIYNKMKNNGALEMVCRNKGKIFKLPKCKIINETNSDEIKNMASQVQSMFKSVDAVKAISYLNAGLSLANLAVNVAGFVMVTEKLSALSGEIQGISGRLTNVSNVQKNEKIGKCQTIIMRYNSMSAKIESDENISFDDIEMLLIDTRAFVSEMVMNLHDKSLDKELLLNMIYTLMPAYTLMLNEFNRRYYFQKGTMPNNYNMFLSLYNELEAEGFLEQLRDYYFLDKKMHFAELTDVMNAHVLLGINGRVQVEDQAVLLKTLETKENVLMFEKNIDKYLERFRAEGVI